MMHLFVLWYLIAALGVVNGKLQPICQPSHSRSMSSPKLPTLPTAFSTSIEVNVVNKNYTTVYKEFYDQKADKGRIERTRNGDRHVDIYDYTLEEILHVDMNAKNCTVTSTIHKGHFQFSFFGFGAHIESVSKLFKFGNQFNETYMGISSVRGIRCHQWRTCIVTNYSSYYLDYYFSVPGWGTTWKMLNSTVIRAVINGTSSNFHRNNGTIVVLNSTHDFYHIYDFFDFRPGPADPTNFQLPEGFYCEGLKGGNKTIPKIPPVFSMEYETVSLRRNYSVSNWQEIYDLEKKLGLFKFPNWWNPSVGPVILIHDFNTGIGYNISGGHPGVVCKPFNLTLREMDAVDDGHHHIRMKTTQELFNTPGRNGSSPFVYKGTTSVRGISADIWVSKGVWNSRRLNRSGEFVMEWHFSKPNWHFLSGSQNYKHQVPLRLDFYTEMGHTEMNLFNFDPEATAPTYFDIKPCFTWEQQRLVRFSLAGKYDKYGGSKEFTLETTKAISVAANVSIIRVNGLRVLEGRRLNKEDIVVTFILLDRTKSMGGDVAVVYPEKGLMDALEALKNSVQKGNFNVKTQSETLRAYQDSFVVGYAPGPVPSGPTTATTHGTPQPGARSKQKKGVSSGAAAGISILMLVVGIVGGLVIAHVIMKRRGLSLFQYQRQE